MTEPTVYGLGLDGPPLLLYILVQRGELGDCQSSEPLRVFAKGRLEVCEDYFQLRLLGGYGQGAQLPDSIFQSPEHRGTAPEVLVDSHSV